MPWFKVDDSFHSHPKALATDPAALGLWVLAGSWSSAHLTEGFVPDDVLPRLLPASAELAKTLVAAGLWRRKRGGYQFHDWLDYNPSKQAVDNTRKGRAERQKRWRDKQRRQPRNASTDGVTNYVPDPTRPEGSGSVRDRPGRPAARGGTNHAPPAAGYHQPAQQRLEAIDALVAADRHRERNVS